MYLDTKMAYFLDSIIYLSSFLSWSPLQFKDHLFAWEAYHVHVLTKSIHPPFPQVTMWLIPFWGILEGCFVMDHPRNDSHVLCTVGANLHDHFWCGQVFLYPWIMHHFHLYSVEDVFPVCCCWPLFWSVKYHQGPLGEPWICKVSILDSWVLSYHTQLQ